MEEFVREQQTAPLRRPTIREGVLGHTIIGRLMMLDAERAEVVAQREEPVLLAVVADAAEHRTLLQHDVLVDVDARLRELQNPFVIGDDVDDVFANR